MEEVRKIVVQALAERARVKIKVRQPLKELRIRNYELKKEKELLELIKEEVNVKEVVFDAKIKEELKLDTEITPELKEEGIIREIIRQIQAIRKKANLKPWHKILISCFCPSALETMLEKNKNFILRETKAKNFILEKKPEKLFDLKKEIEIEGKKLCLTIKKV